METQPLSAEILSRQVQDTALPRPATRGAVL